MPLRFTLTKFDGAVTTVNYGQFSVGPESDGYRLSLSDWQGPRVVTKCCPAAQLVIGVTPVNNLPLEIGKLCALLAQLMAAHSSDWC